MWLSDVLEMRISSLVEILPAVASGAGGEIERTSLPAVAEALGFRASVAGEHGYGQRPAKPRFRRE
jgi:hypothetical protein